MSKREVVTPNGAGALLTRQPSPIEGTHLECEVCKSENTEQDRQIQTLKQDHIDQNLFIAKDTSTNMSEM